MLKLCLMDDDDDRREMWLYYGRISTTYILQCVPLCPPSAVDPSIEVCACIKFKPRKAESEIERDVERAELEKTVRIS